MAEEFDYSIPAYRRYSEAFSNKWTVKVFKDVHAILSQIGVAPAPCASWAFLSCENVQDAAIWVNLYGGTEYFIVQRSVKERQARAKGNRPLMAAYDRSRQK